jgi:hypothetical protein
MYREREWIRTVRHRSPKGDGERMKRNRSRGGEKMNTRPSESWHKIILTSAILKRSNGDRSFKIST